MQKLFQILAKLFKVAFGQTQPYIKNCRNKKLINYWWSEVFHNDFNLKSLARDYPIESSVGYGLIYYYLVNNQVRYIGQTREKSLKWRMTRRQSNRKIGYSYPMKRQMLNAFRSGRLAIKTQKVKIADLDAIERSEIEYYSKFNRLWNIEHNSRYKFTNRWF